MVKDQSSTLGHTFCRGATLSTEPRFIPEPAFLSTTTTLPAQPSLPSSLRHPYLSLIRSALSAGVSADLMGSKGKIEIFLTRCSLHSPVVPAARAASFPSSIWLMGAGEREQGAAYPPACPCLRPIHSAPSCSLVPSKEDGDEIRIFPDQLQTQTDQISSLFIDIFAKGKRARHSSVPTTLFPRK